jgi:hypothetical protein
MTQFLEVILRDTQQPIKDAQSKLDNSYYWTSD